MERGSEEGGGEGGKETHDGDCVWAILAACHGAGVGGSIPRRAGVGPCGFSMQLWAFARLERAEDEHADEGADELREGGEEVEDAEVDSCGFARGRGFFGVAVEVVVQAEGIGGGGVGEAVVGGGWGGEAVDFDADEGKGGPAGEGPGTGMRV